jgi:hypothetical protein
MSKFPVELTDDEGQRDAINYLLSGPAGLGQNFSGFSDSSDKYLTTNLNPPFTSTDAVLLDYSYSVATVERLDYFLIKVNFSTTYITPPRLGAGVWADSLGAFINDYGQLIGVVESTTTYVVIRLTSPLAPTSPVSGGTITMSMFTPNHAARAFQTDCNAVVTVTGATDRVFISGQTYLTCDFTSLPGTWTAGIEVQINRYKALNAQAISNYSAYSFDYSLDEIVARKSYVPSDGNVDAFGRYIVDAAFTSIVDNPPPGYYLYTTQVFVGRPGGSTIEVGRIVLGVRSISVQLVKE